MKSITFDDTVWKLVPIEPTREMIKAMEGQWLIGSQADMAKREYSAMLAATPAPAPAQEAVTLTLAAEDVHAEFTKNFPKTRISQAWISFAADIAQAIAARAAKPAQEVGLTDEEIKYLIPDGDAWKFEVGFTETIAFARAIIAALRAKGGKL